MTKNSKTFNNVYEEYLKYATKRHKKQGLDTIRKNFKNHILPYFKDKDINSITKLDILKWQDVILNNNFSNGFNNALYYEFSSFMNYCVDYDYLTENLVLQVKKFPKKIEIKKHNVYTIWEFRKFRFHLKNYVIKEFFNFMYFNGTRPGEAMALRFSDLEGNIIHIQHNMQRRGKRELDTPKNQSSVRDIKMSFFTRVRINRLKKHYTKTYGSFSNDYFIFGGVKPLSTTTVDRHKKKACEKAKLHQITQHEFRHSYASRMIRKRKPIVDVSKSMGHSRLSTTLDIYTH